MKKRINAIVSEEVYTSLKTMAKEQSTTITEVLKRSIGLYEWFCKNQSEGNQITVERDGRKFEVFFL